MIQNKQRFLLNRAEEASRVLKTHLDQGHIVRIISHNDADGISAAGVICNAIAKEGGRFHVTMVPRLKEKILERLNREKYELYFFCDMGSAYLKKISQLKGEAIVADHHQTMDSIGEEETNLIHVNPHLFGLDGTQDISASGVTYLIVRPLNYVSLAYMALLGAWGDMQYQDGFNGVNKLILADGIDSKTIEVREDLKISFLAEEPLYQALSYTYQPLLPGISGDPQGAQNFLEKLGLSYMVRFEDLAPEEKDVLRQELMSLEPRIFGNVYSITNDIPLLRNLTDYAQILDACGKNKRQGVGLSICLGDRDQAVVEATALLKQYQDLLSKGLLWIRKEGSTSLDNVQFIYTENKKRKSYMGTISSVGLELGILDPDKPVLALSRMDNLIKISARATQSQIQRGINLGKALNDAALSFNGRGGGHDIAAGAVIPYNSLENFKILINDIIGAQLEHN